MNIKVLVLTDDLVKMAAVFFCLLVGLTTSFAVRRQNNLEGNLQNPFFFKTFNIVYSNGIDNIYVTEHLYALAFKKLL